MIRKLLNRIFGKQKKQKCELNEIVSIKKSYREKDLLLKKIQDYSLSVLLGKSRAVNVIVVHSSNSNGHEIRNLDDAELFFKEKFTKKIVYSNGYIPYHFLITQDGRIYETMPLSAPAIGVKGHLNDGVSICCIGNDKSNEQKESVSRLISSLKDYLGVSNIINDNEYK